MSRELWIINDFYLELVCVLLIFIMYSLSCMLIREVLFVFNKLLEKEIHLVALIVCIYLYIKRERVRECEREGE